MEHLAEHHIPDAIALAHEASVREQRHVPALPRLDVRDVLERAVGDIVRHGTGIAALDGSKLAGYMSFIGPIDNFFGTSPGCFSPLHGLAATGPQRRRLFSLLFQHASGLLTAKGAKVFAITTYAHDHDAATALSLNGFGIRNADAIREIATPLETVIVPDITYREIPWSDAGRLLPLKNGLVEHLHRSPTYVAAEAFTPESFALLCEERKSRFFIAQDGDTPIGYMEITDEGESYLTSDPGMLNICGAFLHEQYRGQGIYAQLLGVVIDTLRKEGVRHLGVDFETMNPTALHFWTRYFDPYTYSLARRLDDLPES
ncbi:MAG TPA: GNAT family N-acetyltransferase [Thermomicrobiales bacterium]|nr:GNAT family N-acetyltransferase [Thermomicrobiales bacterium]